MVSAPKIDVILSYYNINKEEPLMRKLLRVGRDVKARRSRVKESMDLKLSALEMDTKLQLVQELIPLGFIHIGEILKEEVKALAGDRYKVRGSTFRQKDRRTGAYLLDEPCPIILVLF